MARGVQLFNQTKDSPRTLIESLVAGSSGHERWGEYSDECGLGILAQLVTSTGEHGGMQMDCSRLDDRGLRRVAWQEKWQGLVPVGGPTARPGRDDDQR